MIVRVAVLIIFALTPWTAENGTQRAQSVRSVEAAPSDCDNRSDSLLDEPSVQTDPGRPIVEKANSDDDDNDNDVDDGTCRSDTLELWHEQEPTFGLLVLNDLSWKAS